MTGTVSRIKHLPGRLAPYFRVRHARGHGIHSPFVFALVRAALLYTGVSHSPEGELYKALRSEGVGRRRAGQIQNLHNYCDYRRTAVIDGAGAESVVSRSDRGSGELIICTADCTDETVERKAAAVSRSTGTLVVVSPRRSPERWRLCRKLAAAADCISIDNRGFILYIYGSGHSPRHYKL